MEIKLKGEWRVIKSQAKQKNLEKNRRRKIQREIRTDRINRNIDRGVKTGRCSSFPRETPNTNHKPKKETKGSTMV